MVLVACGGADTPAPSALEPVARDEARAPALSPADVTASRLRKAAADGDFVMVKALLDRGAEIDRVDPLDSQRNTALHAAVDPGHFPVVKLLVQRGANRAAKNAAGQTPADIARERNHEAIVVLLGMRPASEVVLAPPSAEPVDPAKLDPGALIAKVGDILQKAPPPPASDKADVPEPLAPAGTPPPTVVATQPAAAPSPAAPEQQEVSPELSRKKDELCGQLNAAMGQLTDTEALAALEQAGISRELALQQLEIARSACKP